MSFKDLYKYQSYGFDNEAMELSRLKIEMYAIVSLYFRDQIKNVNEFGESIDRFTSEVNSHLYNIYMENDENSTEDEEEVQVNTKSLLG